MNILRIKIKKDLLGDCYVARGKAKGTVIFLAGLPSYLHKSEFAKELSILGYNIIQPFYYGSWVSGGDFTVSNCLNTLKDTVDTIKSGYVLDLFNNKKINIKHKNVFLLGISFGTNIIQSFPVNKNIRKNLLISAVPIFKKPYSDQIGINVNDFVEFIKKGFPGVYRSNNWSEWVGEFNGNGKILNNFNADDSMTYFIQGSKDKISPNIIKNYIKNEKLKSKLNMVKHAGHSLEQYNQKQLAKIVCNLLE